MLVVGLALSGTAAYAEEPAPEQTTQPAPEATTPAPEPTEPAPEATEPAPEKTEPAPEPEPTESAEETPAEPVTDESEEDVAPVAKAAAPIEALAVATCDLVGGFEIDGNYAAGDCGGSDWLSGGYSSSAVVGTYKVVKDNSDPADWEIGGGTPPKVDFIRNYTKADTVGGDYFLWVGWDREQTSGTGGYVIEVTNAGANFGPDGAPQPIRSSGGAVFYITTQGSSPPVLLQACVYTSTANYPGVCDSSPTAAGFVGAVSTEALTNPFGQSVEAGGFFEVGMNVTELTSGVVAPGCPAPQSATAYQRSFTGNNFGPTGNLKGFVGPSVVEPPSTCGSLTIVKENAAGVRLAGAQFTIAPNPATGTGSTTGTTNASGEIVFSGNVKPGDYVITETVPPAGYLLPTPASQNVSVASLQSASVTFVDPLGTLSWNKVDRDGVALGGATFSVTATGGAAAAAPWELDANPITVVDNTGQGGYTGRDTNPAPGAFTVTGLPTGTYSVAETQAPPEYVLDPTPQSATISQATPNPVIATAFVNTPFATVTVDKTWVNAFDGDTATLGVTGGANAVDTAGGASGTATVKVAPGSSVTVSEILGANNRGSYNTTIMCVGADPSATTGLSAQVTVPSWPESANGVQCTFTNTARETTVSLQKTWVDALQGDAVTARIDVAGITADSFDSVANGDEGSWTDPTVITVPLRVGETFSISEVFTNEGGPAGSYASQWQCTGTGLPANPVGGASSNLGFPNGLIAPEGGAECEFTNTNGKFNVVLVKEWINGEAGDAAELTIDPGASEETSTSISNGQLGAWLDPTNSVTKAAIAGESVTVEELLTSMPPGSEDLYDSSISCTDAASFLDPELTPTWTSAGAAGARTHTFAMPNQGVVCVVTNEAEAPTLELIKTVEGADVPDTNWQLFGTLASGTVITNADGGDVAVTELPAGVDVDLSETVRVPFLGSDEFEAQEWSCTSGGEEIALEGSVAGAATLPGLGKGENAVCEIVNAHVPPGVDFEKTVVSSTDNGGGAWTVVYDITVTNKSVIVPVEYDLSDTLTAYGDAVDYVSASWTGPTSGSFALPTLTANVATDQILDVLGEGTGSDVYTVTVELEVGATAIELEPCVDAETGIGVLNTASLTVDGETTDSEACATVEYDDVSIVKTADLPGDDTSVEAGDIFDYVLTVKNNGTRPAEDVVVIDDTFNDRLQITDLTVSPEGTVWGPAPGYSDDKVNLTIESIPVGGSVEIRVSVLFFSPDPVIEEEGVDSGPIEPPVVVEELVNTACVEAERDNDPTNNCDTIDIPTRDMVAYVYTKCINDAPILGWVVTKSALLIDSPIDFLWVPNNPDVTPETTPAQVAITQFGGSAVWAQEVDWPGSAFTPSGISIDYPGWRAIEASDIVPGSNPTQYYLPGTNTVMTPEQQAQFVFNGLILDPSELDFAWRGQTDITFSSNPTLEYTTPYPPATEDCGVARNTELEIEKSASLETTKPGESFTYDIEVANVSDDAAAESVIVTDAIPADLKVTDVSWPGEGDDTVFPNWETCEVTGADAGGYGGTLECVLFGPLQPINSDNGGASSAPTITLAVTVDPDIATDVVTNVAAVDYHTFGDPEDTGRDEDDAVVAVPYDDVAIVKSVEFAGELDSVEPGDAFEYVLTVTNNGTRPAADVSVIDESLNDRLEITGLTVTPDVVWETAPGFVGNDVNLTIAEIPVDGVVEIRIAVVFTELELVVEEGEPTETPTVLDELTNTACVEAELDENPANDCDTVDVPVREVVASIYSTCVADAPLLGWSITRSASLAGEPITLTWTPTNPDVTPETTPAQVVYEFDGAGTWTDEVAWPGAAFTPSGISVDYPGWRAIEASDIVPGSIPQQYFLPGTDTVMTPGEQAQFVFNGLILDPSELDFAWRGETTIVVSVNPELTFTTGYPPATPDCAVARNTEVQVEKTASIEQAEPGDSFTYDIAVANVSDDAAAEGVVVTDEIPADIRVTDVSWPGEGDASVFPNWETCEVTGADAGGYGGTLECVLFGPLQPINSDNGGATSAPTITLSSIVRASSDESVITNVAVVDYHTFGDPEDTGRDADDAVVLLSALPPTGGGPLLPLTLMALVALLAGLSALLAVRSRNRHTSLT